ncbi:uncharacterized protein K02A2.6-like [Macrosteles quadrilineatus]|uniref:uncharacterized protein K02A2.6-like n=1 Tax=Macrosteles quadrilineatus TaxID=74068 RepID=UPI0023E1C5E0|nr:uncharacterized protein K02A2.6-like [Macrosteles quadrilineatus]
MNKKRTQRCEDIGWNNKEEVRKRMEKFSIEPYDEKLNWEDYEAHFQLMCKVKGLGDDSNETEEARRDLLLAYVGPVPLKKVSNFVLPRQIYDIPMTELIDTFWCVYKPSKTIFAARLDFEKCVRGNDESFSNFVLRLKELASYCKYDRYFEERVRDRFAGGVNFPQFEVEIRQRWPEGINKDGSRLTLNELVDLAEAMDRAKREMNILEEAMPVINKVHNYDKKNRSLAKETYSHSTEDCNQCGLVHSEEFCPAQKSKCFSCGKQGHFSRQCGTKKTKQCHFCGKMGHFPRHCRSKKAYLNQINDTDIKSEEEEVQLGISELKPNRKIPRAQINVTLNEVPTTMEFDSGARASMIDAPLWKQIGSPNLRACKTKFVAYGNNTLDVLGECEVNVKVDGQIRKLKAAVVNGNESPLFGLPWMLAFNMKLPPSVTIRKLDNTNKDENASTVTEEEINQVISEFSDVFKKELGTIKGYQAKIHVKSDSEPRCFPARRVPFPLRSRVEQELNRLVSDGVIEKVDPSKTPIEWATPTVNVEKENGTIRICGDFRVTLNPNIITHTTLLPTFEELTNKVSRGKQYSVVDLRDAYLQMEVSEEDRKYLVISTHVGYYRYKRLPFGITSSPGIFQEYMEKLLEGIPQVGVLLDDVIITGRNKEEHLMNLKEVLKRMSDAGLKAKKEKCRFMQNSVTYLGHIIDERGIHPTKEKIEAIQKAPKPTNVKQLRSFLGSINYYERFIPRLHALCSRLHRLTSNRSKWIWTEKEDEVFTKVKMILSEEDTVVPYDESKPLVLVCDASEDGLGSVLMHKCEYGLEKPIAYASRTLSDAEKRYSNIDREALAILFAVRKFHQYVYGRSFTLVTDHKPLQRIFGENRNLPKVMNNRLVRWALELNQYNFQIKYRKGDENVCADALSRLPIRIREEATDVRDIKFLNMDKVETLVSYKELKHNSSLDKEIKLVQSYVLNAWPEKVPDNIKTFKQRKEELSVEDGVLMWFGRVVVPTNMRKKILRILHCGHPGISAMRSITRYYVWWPDIDKDVEMHVKTCEACQENRGNIEEVPVYPWNIPEKVWERVHLDLAGPVDGVMWLVGIDALSKWAEVECLRTTTSTAIIQRLRSWMSRYGIPSQVVTDNGPQFVSTEMEAFFKRHSIRHIRTTPYHPRSNGLVERLIGTLKRRYRTTKQEINDSSLALQNVLFSYRNAPQKTTGRAPAELFLGRRMPTMLDNMKPNLRQQLDLKIWKEQQNPTQKKTLRAFSEGEEVWIKKENNPGWIAGTIVKRNGLYSYEVMCGGVIKRKHLDQLRRREGAVDDEEGKV